MPALEQATQRYQMNSYYRTALDLVLSGRARNAFNLSAEPANIHERYGRNTFGQCCLLARRLAEAGVPMINVHYCHTPDGSWDTHGNHFGQMKSSLCCKTTT